MAMSAAPPESVHIPPESVHIPPDSVHIPPPPKRARMDAAGDATAESRAGVADATAAAALESMTAERDSLRAALADTKALLAERDAALAEARRQLEMRGRHAAAAATAVPCAIAPPQLREPQRDRPGSSTHAPSGSAARGSSGHAPMPLGEAALLEAAREGRLNMSAVPAERLTRRVCLEFVGAKPANMRAVPRALRDGAFDREALMLDAWAFGYLDRGDKTEALLIDAVRESERFDPAMLAETWAVPNALLTRAVVDAAIARQSRSTSRWTASASEITLEWVRKRDPGWV